MIKVIFFLFVFFSPLLWRGAGGEAFAQKQGQAKIDSLLAVLSTAKEDTSKVNTLIAITREKNNIGENEEAMKYADEALALSEKIRFKKGTAKSYSWIGYVYSNLSDYTKALVNYQKSLTIYEQLGYKFEIAYHLQVIGDMYNNLSDYPKALGYNQKALAINEQLGRQDGIANNLQSIATTYWFLCDYPKALEYDQKALTINEKLGNRDGIARNLMGMGSVYTDLSDNHKALEYFQKALSIFEQLGNKQGIANSLGSIGLVYYRLSDFHKALEYYQKALTIYEQLGNKASIARNLGNIGFLYIDKFPDYHKALEYLQKALYIEEEIGDKNTLSWTFNTIGTIYRKQRKNDDALKYETKGLSLALKIGEKDQIKDSYGEIAVIDSAMGNFRGAYENHKLYMQYNDSMFSIEKDKKITTLAMNYEFAKLQDSTNAVQAQKDAVAVKEVQKHRLVRNGFIGGFAVMIFFAGVFFTQRNSIKKGKKLSDELLLNILPSEVAKELKQKGSAEAKMFDDVTVMFTDFKGFTKISEKLSPKELVAEINYCFSAFDNIIQKYGIEKIKTIGDSYMAAGGLPVANKTHAKDVVNAALEITNFMEDHKRQRIEEGKEVFEIRIGIHTGSVVAGIVGVKKFAYDIWGDTVNLAARMESSGEAGKINISGSTFELVKDKFNCVHRGKIQAKNKGEVDMYFVEL